MKKDNKGFSLVELIVVVAIMAVLMVVATPALLRYVEKTRIQKDESAVAEVQNAVKIACAEESVYDEVVTALESGAVTVTVTTGAQPACTASSKLATELSYTMGKIDFSSKTHKAQTATITITYDATSQAIVVSDPAWS